MSFAATLCTSRIAEGISQGEAGVFMHGPTFMANPLACAVSIASIELLLANDWQSNIQRIEKALNTGFSPAKAFIQVADVRVLGAIGVIEMKQPVNMHSIQAALVEAGVWVRPFGKLIYVMPPFIMQDTEIAQLCQAIIQVISDQ